MAAKVGHGVCPSKKCTAVDAYFSRTSGGKLKYECRRCDTNGYSDNVNGSGEKDWLSGIIDAAPTKTTDTPAPPEPAPTKKREAFSLGL